MIHKSVAESVNGLKEFLETERKRVPGGVLFEADRLECQRFEGYDPEVSERWLDSDRNHVPDKHMAGSECEGDFAIVIASSTLQRSPLRR